MGCRIDVLSFCPMTSLISDQPDIPNSGSTPVVDHGLGRWPEPTVTGDETATWLGSIERQRATFAWKVGGLDAAGLRATVGASAVTLGGLLAHLARCEDSRFPGQLLGRDPHPSLAVIGRGWQEDWAWAAEQSPEDLYRSWSDAVVRSREAVVEALRRGGLDQPTHVDWPDATPTIRRAFADILEEYARHVGHADIIRESIDGVVGEDPPEFAPRPPWPAPAPEYRLLLDY
jgi:Protein of unknown function (DUF664)